MKTTLALIFSLVLSGPFALKADGGDVSRQLIERLNRMTPEQAVATQYGWEIPGKFVWCTGSLPSKSGEVPVLLCQWGPGANVVVARSLFWEQGGRWRSQPYPSEGIRGTAGFIRAYQNGNDLMVIMNVGIAQTRYAEQPQLLKRSDRGWHIFWLPPLQEWSGHHATVQFQGDALKRFLVWTDRSVLPEDQRQPFTGNFGLYLERWERRGDGYVRVDRTEAQQPEMAVVHFFQALTRGDDTQASDWVTDQRLILQAKAQGVHKVSVGFVQPVRVKGLDEEHVWGVAANNYDRKPNWLVTVEWREGRWRVSDITPGEGPQAGT